MVLVEITLNNTLTYEADVLHLRIYIQCSMKNLLDYVRGTVWTMNIHELCLLVNIGLVTLRSKCLPKRRKILSHANHSTSLDIKVTRIIPCANGKVRDMFKRLVFSLGARTLTIAVKLLIIKRCHEGIILVGVTMPCAVSFIDFHVVHLDRKPYIHGSMPLSVIHITANRETIGSNLSVLDAIDTRLNDFRKINLCVIVSMIVYSPDIYFGIEDLFLVSVVVYLQDGSSRKHSIITVKFHHSHLFLCWSISYLRKANIRFTNPAGIISSLNIPACNLSRLASWKYGASHEHAILRKVTAIKEFDVAVGCHRNHKVIPLRSHHEFVSYRHRLHLNILFPTSVIKSRQTIELRDPITIRAHPRVASRVMRKNLRSAIHHEVGTKIRCREEFQIKTGLAL